MRICLDTNVLVSGIFWKGIPGKILDLWADGKFEIVVSLPIIDEYKRVLKRIGLKIDLKLAEAWIQTIIEKATIVAPMHPKKRWGRDVEDDKFIECAIMGKAKYLVSGDEDLLALKDRVPIKIVTPKEFIKRV